ncbi:aminotransferase DegT [Reichenbachiella sp. 5M10]|nr:aminotransferase DegT [Reichenbachiella sp. 5M10]
MAKTPVNIPFLPPIEEYNKYLEGIWERNWLTNDGLLVQALEKKLMDKLNVEQLAYVSNGTVALQIAIKTLQLSGEIITTPFSYVATTSSIVWEGCTPVFVDVDEKTFNISPHLIEASITPKTTAILATHVFGTPCEIDQIQLIAQKHGLKVIYDAAHCFGSTYKGSSVLNFGDISTISFHATKVFHSTEGGAVICRSPEIIARAKYMRNFGHDGPEKFNGVGINGKNSEFHAAMGLCNLEYIDAILAKRKSDSEWYDSELSKTNLTKQHVSPNSSANYSYYPVLFSSQKECKRMLNILSSHDIHPRRYFFPSLSSLNYVTKTHTPISDNIASRILCLPLYYSLTKEEISHLCKVIIQNIT